MNIQRDLAKLREHEDSAVKAIADSLVINCGMLHTGLLSQFSSSAIEEQRSQFAKLALLMKDEEQTHEIKHLRASKTDVKDVKAAIRKVFEVKIDTDVLHTHTHIYTYTHIHIYTYTHTHTHTGDEASD